MWLRQEVSKSQALLLVAASVAYGAARAVAGPLSPAQVIVVLLVLEFVVQPLSTLVHEWGDALVARRVSSGPVSLIVGRGPYLAGTVGRVRINFSMFPARGVRIGGFCRYGPADVSWRDRAVGSLAGPTATFLELAAAAVATVALWSGADPFVRNLLLLVVIGLAVSVVVNLIPHAIIPGVLSNDGATALRCLRNDRAGAPRATPAKPVDPHPPKSITNGPGTSSTGATVPLASPDRFADTQPPITMDRDRARGATSIPPPAPRR